MISIESEERPWGRFFVIHDQPKYKLKRIEVDPGGRLSYQYHHKRSEAWTKIDGVGDITLNGVTKEYKVGETILIPQGVKHRIENKKSEFNSLISQKVNASFAFSSNRVIFLVGCLVFCELSETDKPTISIIKIGSNILSIFIIRFHIWFFY